MNQKRLRAELYQGLHDAVADPVAKTGTEKTQIGTQVILPATYPGCPRAMQQNYLDALAIVRKYGRLDYFITMTANPTWPEIQENLGKGEAAHNRPDLVARVFHMKFQMLLDELLREDVLGKVLAYTWVIEFQKRGLPHAHLLLIVRPEDKIRTTQDVDKRIVAELPDPEKQPELARIISRSQIHGPCGARNCNAPCMEKGSCLKHYPKVFTPATTFQESGYPVYRRREDSPTAMKADCRIDARDVVPYNPYLSKRLNCHLNIEHCASIKAVKYLFKYTYKGHDRASMQFQLDEVTRYLDTRYVGPPEACWRIFKFGMYDISHKYGSST